MAEKLARWLPFRTEPGHTRRFYRKSLIMLLFIASIPGLVTGFIIYWLATDHMQSELQQLHQKQIQQRAENVDDQLAYLELMFSHWSFDTQFDAQLRELDFVYDYEKIHNLYRTLLVMEGSHPLIEKVEFYLNAQKPYLFTKDIYYTIEDSQKAAYEKLLMYPQYEYWTHLHGTGENAVGELGADAPLTLINKVPGGSSGAFGYIAATVDKARLGKLLKTLTPYNEGTTFLMSKSNGWMVTGNNAEPGSLEQALKQQYEQKQGKTDSFVLEHEGTTYSVSFGQFSRLGTTWVYVSAAPLTAITAPVLIVSKLILWISACGFLIALTLSFLASRRLYSPIARVVGLLSKEHGPANHRDEFELIEEQWLQVMKERQTLRNRVEEQLPFMREGFLLQLVQGYLFSHTEKELRERLRHYGWEPDGKQYTAVFAELNGFANLEGRFDAGDEDLVTFAAANIIAELSEERLPQVQLLNFHDLTIGLLIATPEGKSSKAFRAELQQLCGDWVHAVGRVLRMRMTITIGKHTSQVKQIPFLFEEARRALNYGDLGGESQIIDLEQLVTDGAEQDLSYPFAREKEIIHAVRAGSEEEALELIELFIRELAGCSPSKVVVQQGMLQLLGSLQHAMLEAGINPVQLFEGANRYEELAAVSEPEELLKWFRIKIVGPFVRELISKQNHHLKQMVEKTLMLISEKFISPDLSLESCADQFGTSPYTLSRAFKQMTGVNFIDYVTNLRIERAKELLRETDKKINEIAESVSYQHTYFNRIFKKYEGVTPSQYREMSRTV
ncbi:helix-turn-helix domain-containing protein [Paenibacillus turpanensis]|uniref:helix-turn-helix domain-containing protein n=1 Tax=Paenibacillus turpanensis TaxID=2689078 RepID=UPI00140A7C33|nr:helix-turn-helix domain-containing protein [Paenibacillus turpanensis]